MFGWVRRVRQVFPLSFHTEYFFEHTLQQLPQVEIPSSVEIKVIASSELPTLLRVWPVSLQHASRRVERGDLCYCAFLNKEIVSYHWVQYSGTHFLQQAGTHYQVHPKEGWIYHVRVASQAQGRNINSMVYSKILSDAKEGGKRRMCIYTASTNVANQKGLVKCGFKLTHRLISFRFGNRFFLLFNKKCQ